MDTFILVLALLWLGIVSWFDLRTKEIPHSAWVIVPLCVAVIYRIAYSGWELVVLTLMICVISERKRLGQLSGNNTLASVFVWLPLVVVSFFRAASVNSLGAVAILAFWLAWELHCWGGADAVASITLILLWPEMTLVLALLVVHLIAALTVTFVSLVRDRKFQLHAIPGLPLLLVTVLVHQVFLLLPGMVG
jgi:hypothetical protein